MRRRILLSLAAAAALMLPAMSYAQDGPPAGGPPGMRGGQGRGQMSTIAWLLQDEQTKQFKPTGDQVAKLQEIQKKYMEDTQPLRDEMQKAREEMMNGGGDRQAMFEKIRPIMEKQRKADEEATEAAVKLLNDEQQKVVKDLLDARRKEMEARRGRFGQ